MNPTESMPTICLMSKSVKIKSIECIRVYFICSAKFAFTPIPISSTEKGAVLRETKNNRKLVSNFGRQIWRKLQNFRFWDVAGEEFNWTVHSKGPFRKSHRFGLSSIPPCDRQNSQSFFCGKFKTHESDASPIRFNCDYFEFDIDIIHFNHCMSLNFHGPVHRHTYRSQVIASLQRISSFYG